MRRLGGPALDYQSVRAVTSSDVVVEAEVAVNGFGSYIELAWLVYDPEPCAGEAKREKRIIRFPIDPKNLGRLEKEHLIEQAEVEATR